METDGEKDRELERGGHQPCVHPPPFDEYKKHTWLKQIIVFPPPRASMRGGLAADSKPSGAIKGA
jgi:hypothetical protein